MEMLVLVVPIIAGFFWISQLADVILIDRRRFESHTHRLVWFLVIVIGNIIGAVWYFVWKRQQVATPEPLRPQIAGGVCPECDQRIVTVTDTNFVKNIRAAGGTMPIFLLSSTGDDLTTMIDYSSLGLSGVFQKPIAREKLLTVLKAKLG